MNTFLITSEFIYYINKKINELKKDITNVITFNMENDSLDSVLEEASYFSMFDDKKCIIVKNASIFSSSKDSSKTKEDSQKLLNYLEHENKNTLLIFVSSKKGDSKKKIYKLLKDNNNVFEFPSLTKTEMKNELNKIVLENKYKIDDNSLWFIINNSFNNLDIALNELNKIFLFYNEPTTIKYEDVKELVSKVVVDNNFNIVDSIINRDLENSLKYLKELKILKVEPTVILALLYREFRLMLSILIYEDNKYKESEIESQLKLAPWQYQKIKNNLRKYNKRELEESIINLSEIDFKLKSGLINKDLVLINFIMENCD